MKRYPEGIKGISFHQHNVDEALDYVRTATLDVEEGHQVDYIVGDNLATLLYMANLGSIERQESAPATGPQRRFIRAGAEQQAESQVRQITIEKHV
jgi:DNA primase